MNPKHSRILISFKVSYQNNNPRLINSDYIYRKINKKAKKAKPLKKDLPLLENDKGQTL
jgi:predicted nucleic acid-binding protein